MAHKDIEFCHHVTRCKLFCFTTSARGVLYVVDGGAAFHRFPIYNIKYSLARSYFKRCVFGSSSRRADQHAHLPGAAH